MDTHSHLAASTGAPRSTASSARVSWRHLAVGLLVGLLSLQAWAQDDPPGRVGRIAQTTGVVRSFEGEGWIEADRNAPLSTGDRVTTDRGGSAVIQIGSTVVRLGSDTLMIVARLDDERVRLRLDHGVMTMNIRSPEVAGEFAIETVDGFMVPRQPTFMHVAIEAGHTQVAVWSGMVEFQGRDATEMNIQAGQRGEYWREGPQQVTHYRWVAMPTDSFANWAQTNERDADRSYAAGNANLSPEMTGAAELDRYGRWSNTPDYGPIWVPTVAVGWAPYRDGHWAWVPPWGWTWVDNAPWGFAPFHYGRWHWWGGRWGWVPGVYIARPAYAPALVGWVGGSGFSLTISAGVSAPAVGWVPLAPFEPFYPAYAVSPRYWNRINNAVAYPPLVHRGPGVPRIVPTGPLAYANRNVSGAVTVLPAQALVPHQRVTAVPRPAGQAQLIREVAAGRAEVAAPPPAPAGRGELNRDAPRAEVRGPLQRITPVAVPASPRVPQQEQQGQQGQPGQQVQPGQPGEPRPQAAGPERRRPQPVLGPAREDSRERSRPEPNRQEPNRQDQRTRDQVR